MGWSIDNIRPQIDVIFDAENKRYSMQHPNALSPRVYIQHEGELSTETTSSITNLFPEFVYVDFFPNMVFTGEPPVKRTLRRVK